MEKKNCWEFMKCGREPGGRKADKLGVCPAAASNELEGVNFGKYCGRICWAVAGTYCDGVVGGTFAQKLMSCINCKFFKSVNNEEGREFHLTPVIKRKIKK